MLITRPEILQGFLQRIAPFLGIDVEITDEHGKVIASCDPGRINSVSEELPPYYPPGAIAQLRPQTLELGERKFLPLFLNGKIEGWLTFPNTLGRDETLNLASLLQTALEEIMALELATDRMHFTSREEENLIAALLSPDAQLKEKELKNKAIGLGYDLNLPRSAIVLQLEPKENRYFNINLHLGYDVTQERIKQKMIQLIKENAYLTRQDLVATYVSHQIVVLKAFIDDCCLYRIYQALDVIADKLYEAVKDNRIFEIALAYGSLAHSIESLRQSYLEAVEIIELGKVCGKMSGVISGDTFMVEALVCSLPGRLIHGYLQPIIEKLALEKEEGENILATAEAFIDNNFNVRRTAEKNFLHRNTVTARLDKLRELTGLDPRRGFQEALRLKMVAVYNRLQKKKNNKNKEGK